LTAEIERKSLLKGAIKWGRGADRYHRRAHQRRGDLQKVKGLGNAIDDDDFRSSNWLRTKDFQPCDSARYADMTETQGFWDVCP